MLRTMNMFDGYTIETTINNNKLKTNVASQTFLNSCKH